MNGGSREFASTTWVYEFRDNDTEYEVFFESTDTDYYNLVINNPAGQSIVIQATRWDY